MRVVRSQRVPRALDEQRRPKAVTELPVFILDSPLFDCRLHLRAFVAPAAALLRVVEIPRERILDAIDLTGMSGSTHQSGVRGCPVSGSVVVGIHIPGCRLVRVRELSRAHAVFVSNVNEDVLSPGGDTLVVILRPRDLLPVDDGESIVLNEKLVQPSGRG